MYFDEHERDIICSVAMYGLSDEKIFYLITDYFDIDDEYLVNIKKKLLEYLITSGM
jgi:hypothetical protein